MTSKQEPKRKNRPVSGRRSRGGVRSNHANANKRSHMNHSTLPVPLMLIRAPKSGTRKRHKSLISDGDFINSLNEIGYFRRATRWVSPVVVGRLPVSLPHSHPESVRLKPKAWRDTGEAVKGLFFHEALASEPGVKAFTLMLTRPVEALARSKGKHCLAWLHRRVVRQLKPLGERYTSGAVPFWFAIEESDKGRLHIHGEISIGDLGAEKRTIRSLRRIFAPIRAELKAAGGNWDFDRDGDGTQLRFSRGTPDARWAGYCVKGVDKARPERRRFMKQYGSPRRWVAGFEGKAVTANRAVAFEAMKMHRQKREEALHPTVVGSKTGARK